MEFANRAGQQAAASVINQNKPNNPGSKKSRNKLLNIISVFLLVAIAMLIVVVTYSVATSKKANEAALVDNTKYQAVFLEGGSVYFGKIRELNKQFIAVDNIYYLRVNEAPAGEQGEQAQQQDVSLTKLGCELHGPQDQMVINRAQVSFWENLKDDGQVAKAIAEFVKQNPEGQKCAEPQS